MSLNVTMKAKVLKGLEEMFQENTVETIKMMAKKYGFSEEEALAYMNVTEEVKVVKSKAKEVKEPKEKKVKEKKEKKEGPKMVLPFCGRIVEEWCEGVKLNHGLYSQCASERCEEKYCKSCKKQAETNESGKPTLGDINERMLKSSAEYRAEKGKKCVVYAVVMKKLKITKEEAVAEALKFGLEIPEEEFEMPKSQRGRPKKLSESESVKSGSDEGEKKRRGRPKKNKTVAENHTDETDDLIASLVAEANALKSGSAREAEESVSETDAEEMEEEEEEEEESENSVLLKEIVAKINADETYNKMNCMVVPKKERKKHLNAMGEHIKTLLTEEELALYTGAPEEEEEEEVEDEATRKAREAAEKKAQVEAEKKAQAKQKKEEADLEKKAKAELEKKAKAEAEAEKKAQLEAEKKAKAEAEAKKKAQLEAEKKAKAEADKKAKAEADAEKKLQVEAEKKAKKEQADLEKKQKKEQAEADKKAKEEAAALKKAAEKKPAEVTPVEKETTAELQAESVEEPSVAESSVAESSVAEARTTETVNAKVFEFQGKKYLKTEDGILYDQETEDCVGVWNEETNSIDDFADDDQ